MEWKTKSATIQLTIKSTLKINLKCNFLEMREANICKIRLEELNYDILSRLVTPGPLSLHASTELLLLPPVVGVGQQSPSLVYNALNKPFEESCGIRQ